jgi:AcrR family transcriptional regulator
MTGKMTGKRGMAERIGRSRPRAVELASAAAGRKPVRRALSAKKTGKSAPYHHGALHDALLAAAERVLEREGLAALTLRAVAREAGVSHAAPTHHFGDLRGLVSELAAVGFRQFNAAMAQAESEAGTAAEKMMARAKSYVAYAQAHPGIYGLMFRTERLDMTRPTLSEAAKASFAGLSLDQAAAIVRAWSLVHGFTMLLLEGRLADILKRLPKGISAEKLLDAMLKTSIMRPQGI